MSGRITREAKAQHHCHAGWRIETADEAAVREAQAVAAHADGDDWFPSLPTGMRMMIEHRPWAEEGTIWTCDDCGLDWKAIYPYRNVFAPTWVRHHPIKPIRWPWKRSKP